MLDSPGGRLLAELLDPARLSRFSTLFVPAYPGPYSDN